MSILDKINYTFDLIGIYNIMYPTMCICGESETLLPLRSYKAGPTGICFGGFGNSSRIYSKNYLDWNLYRPIVEFCISSALKHKTRKELVVDLIMSLQNDGYVFERVRFMDSGIWLSKSAICMSEFNIPIACAESPTLSINEFIPDRIRSTILTTNPSYTYRDTRVFGDMLVTICPFDPSVRKYIDLDYAEFSKNFISVPGYTVDGRLLPDPHKIFNCGHVSTTFEDRRAETLKLIVDSFKICPIWGSTKTCITTLSTDAEIPYEPLRKFHNEQITFNELYVNLLIDGYYPLIVSDWYALDVMYEETLGDTCISNAFGYWPTHATESVPFNNIVCAMVRRKLI